MALLFWLSILFIIYTYLGYPLIILVLAKLKSRPKPYPESFPNITFLIAAYNEEAVMESKIQNTLAIDYPREKIQVIIAADGSSDQTPEIVKKYVDQHPEISLSYTPDRNGKMAAITRAILLARGTIIVFSDANNMYDPEAVRVLVAPFIDPTVGATTGAKLIVEDGRNLSSAEGLYWKYESAIKTNETLLGTCTSSAGEIFAIRKELFVPPAKNIINDDRYMVFDLIHRGFRVIYTPDARSYEYVSKSAKDEITRRSRINSGAYQTIAMSGRLLPFDRPLVLWQMISHKYFRAFVPFAMLIALLSNIALVIGPEPARLSSIWSLTYPYNWVFLVLQTLFYVLAIIGNLINFRGAVGKALYIPVFLLNSNLAAAAGFYSFLTNRQSHLWKRVDR